MLDLTALPPLQHTVRDKCTSDLRMGCVEDFPRQSRYIITKGSGFNSISVLDFSTSLLSTEVSGPSGFRIQNLDMIGVFSEPRSRDRSRDANPEARSASLNACSILTLGSMYGL